MKTLISNLLSAWRRFFWHTACGGRLKLGKNIFIYESVKLAVQPDGKLTLAGGAALQKGVVISVAPQAEACIGEAAYIGEYSVLMVKHKITIGPHAMIGPHCVFADYEHSHEGSETMTPDKFSCRPVTIEENAWLGAGVKVLAGVTIGRGAVIGAGSVVNRDIPAYAVAAGVPAKVIRSRDKALTP